MAPDLELHAKKTGQLEDLKMNYVLNKKSVQLCYELHRLHAIVASHTSTNH